MLISEETKLQLDELVKYSFDANAVVDNYAYNLAFYRFPNIEEIVHLSFAHKFPEFSDIITDMMIRLNARPVRKGLPDHVEDFSGDLYKIFEGILGLCNTYRESVIDVIDTAEMNGDYEVKIRLEEFLIMFESYRKQADIWFEYAKRYKDDYKSFDVHFKDITTFIEVEDKPE